MSMTIHYLWIILKTHSLSLVDFGLISLLKHKCIYILVLSEEENACLLEKHTGQAQAQANNPD